MTADAASRGPDVVGLLAVVNYDWPIFTADFVNSPDRTGRVGKQGYKMAFVTAPSESHLKLIEKRHLPRPIIREVLPGFEPDELE
mmetsp:Transcript_26366/g.30166  ORF Transcript_26366/g.30166 Transcript_26366/m.30166 type:complete len:85 (+) Transcript_26366:1356-1610(+)